MIIIAALKLANHVSQIFCATDCVCVFCSDSETGAYMLTVGQRQELMLTATVYNAGEEAHQAILSVTLPPNLDYVGTSSEVWHSHILLHIFYVC